ncbi:site-specific recombinase [Herbaspirillum sp. Sphag1AN]|uniref:preprotein translocase subunit TatB n=1 Tax=unclassified Herbaspirillum TaxID=2624150 RepID=UPI0016080E39|nr:MULTISPECIES: preprotein translocase subunit TatB [unclassified Herbaspirillum]MBB3213280.1 site-specific recombinase [Herbaspirillum sp. Sphag1AN]MBB3246676.1 site-specific recombinase [Herbaspirillum sp. Sphag64]
MKFLLLKIRVIWRRLRFGMKARCHSLHDDVPQLSRLLRRADPEAAWHQRANWMIDVAEWLRQEPKINLRDAKLRSLLDWLDLHRDVRRQVQVCLQRTLREAGGAELFSVTGLPHEAAFFSELTERALRRILPRHLSPSELPNLFAAMFPAIDDAQWLLVLDAQLLDRAWKLAADDGISHTYWQQTEEALVYLMTLVVADGISPAFRQRLDPHLPLRASPFMALRHEMENYLHASPNDKGALRSIRMLIAVCQAQTDRIYAYLDKFGVSVGLVYRLERMRAQLVRMGRLIDVRACKLQESTGGDSADRLPLLLADLVAAHHQRASMRSLIQRSFALVARKLVERNADDGEQSIARDANSYLALFKAASIGGAITGLTVQAKITLGNGNMPHFFEGMLASFTYVVSFLFIAAMGGVLATKQPAVTAPALAARMDALDTLDGLRALVAETAVLLRSQVVSVMGNLVGVMPVMLFLMVLGSVIGGASQLSSERAQLSVQSLSLIGPTPLYAAVTGILLWLSSLIAGLVDNWFAWRRLREILAQQRRLIHLLGATRASRWARWLDRHVGTIAGNIALGIALGMTPMIARFFGIPFEVRHVTLAAGNLVAACVHLGWEILLTPGFWLAALGIVSIAVLNISVAFGCAMWFALRARDIPVRLQRIVVRAVLRRMRAQPALFLFPEKPVKRASVKESVVEEES